MRIEGEKRRPDVHNLDLSGSAVDDGSLSGWRAHDVNLAGLRVDKANLAGATIANARMERMTIDGVAVTDLLAYWQAGHGAKGA